MRWLAILGLCTGALALAAGRSPTGASPPARAGGSPVATVFQRDCATCHGNDARGTTRGPTLVGVGRASLDYWLSTGRMPLAAPDAAPERSDPAYSPHEIRALIGYIESLTGASGLAIPAVDVAGADVANGGVLYRAQCAACHSWAGEGGALVDRAAPSVHQATPRQIAEAIRIGPGRMPAFGSAALDDAELDDVVAYTDYLDDPSDRGGWPLGHLGPLAEGAIALGVGLALLIVALRWIGVRT